MMENHFRTLIYATDTLYINQTFASKHLQEVAPYVKKQCEKGILESVKKKEKGSVKKALQKN